MWVMGKNYLIKELKDLITEKYPYADNIINWQFYHINKNYNSINYLHADYYETILFCRYIDKWILTPPKLVLFSNINHYHKRENYYKEQVQIMVETKEQYWNDKEFKPMKKNPLDLTKKDVLDFDPILVLDFNNYNTIIDGNHRWVVSKKLNSKIPCIYLKRKNNEHPLKSKIKSLALQLFGDKRLFKND